MRWRPQFVSAAALGLAGSLCSAPMPAADGQAPHRYGWPMQSAGTYIGWSGARWSRDYGIASGRCNRADIAGIALVPNRNGTLSPQVVVSGSARSVGTLRSPPVRDLVGGGIRMDFDERDRDCMGHALEIGKPNRSVRWLNPGTGLTYALIPGRETRSRQAGAGFKCRDYVLIVGVGGGANHQRPGIACQSEPGLWIIQ